MKQNKIDKIRMDNLFILMGTNAKDGTITSLADATGVARQTLSGVMHGKAMLIKHARKIEKVLEKPFGWMDRKHDDDELSPMYTKAVLHSALECIDSSAQLTELFESLNAAGKTDLLDKLYHLYTDPAARKLSPKTILTILGAENEIKNAGITTGVKTDT